MNEMDFRIFCPSQQVLERGGFCGKNGDEDLGDRFTFGKKTTMPYSDFTLTKLRHNFKLEHQLVKLFPMPVTPIQPSERLQFDIQEGLNFPNMTEKAKSEWLVAPILKELHRNKPHFSIFSGYSFDIEKEEQLNGICDFILSAKTQIVELEAPVFCLIEAKRDSIEDGWGQCAAAMLAARKFNLRDNKPINTIFGAVTNAFDWAFMKLEGDTVYIDNERYYLKELSQLLGRLDYVLELSLEEAMAVV